MGIKFFGQFLIDKNLITKDDLQKAVTLARKSNLLFGETARSMGLITHADVERVQAAQRTEDLNFGDLCVKMGLLTTDQMKQVAQEQKKKRLHLGDALVRLGFIKAEDLSPLLAEYDADQAPYYEPKEPNRPPVPNEDLWELYATRAYNMFTRVIMLAFKPDQRSIVDGIDPNDTVVGMRMTGDAPCCFVLSVSAEIRAAIARGIMRQEDISSEPEEVLVDAVREFVNIICGSIASKVTQMGKKIDYKDAVVLDVQDRFCGPSSGSKALLFPLHVAEGRAEVAIFGEE
jgi:CheY-specific phosphatase CheX